MTFCISNFSIPLDNICLGNFALSVHEVDGASGDFTLTSRCSRRKSGEFKCASFRDGSSSHEKRRGKWTAPCELAAKGKLQLSLCCTAQFRRKCAKSKCVKLVRNQRTTVRVLFVDVKQPRSSRKPSTLSPNRQVSPVALVRVWSLHI